MVEKSSHLLVLTVVSLLALGIVMLLSTSVFVEDHFDDIYFDIRRQIIWLVVGGFVCALLALTDYHFWDRTKWIWFGLACVLLACCFWPLVSEERNGARRWLSGKSFGMSFLRMQPSELAKLACLFVLAGWLSKYRDRIGEFRMGFVYPLLIMAVPIALVAAEIDIGSAALIATVVILVLYVAGTRMAYLAAAGGLVGGFVSLAILNVTNRMERFLVFWDIEAHKTDFGMQQWRGFLAMGEGGTTGLGLGNGREKLMHLPYAHTDFIFPMIGEELGLVATLLVVFAYVVFIVAGMLIAMHASDRFGKLLGFGLVCIIIVQAMINIGVTTVLLPNKGLPLPFVSYGGSNLLLCLMCVGILLNIYRQGTEPGKEARVRMPANRMTPRV